MGKMITKNAIHFGNINVKTQNIAQQNHLKP